MDVTSGPTPAVRPDRGGSSTDWEERMMPWHYQGDPLAEAVAARLRERRASPGAPWRRFANWLTKGMWIVSGCGRIWKRCRIGWILA